MNIKKAYKKYIKKTFSYISYLDDDGNGVELDIKNKTIVFHENNESEDKVKLQFARSLKSYDFFDIAKTILKLAVRRQYRDQLYFYICGKSNAWKLLDRLRDRDIQEFNEEN